MEKHCSFSFFYFIQFMELEDKSMYEISEFYAVDGSNLKDLLKSCIYNYYVKNKDKIMVHNENKKGD